MPDATPPVERTWGPGRSVPPAVARRRRLLAVLLAVTAFVVGTIAVLSVFSVSKSPALLPVWVTAEPGSAGPVPWAARDRAALLDGDWLGRPLDDPGTNPGRDQLRLRFRGLARVRASQPLVIHLAAPASVTAYGGVYLLPADPAADTLRNPLLLAELLGYVRDCPARHKFLVLNLTPPPEDPRFAPQPGDLSAAVHRTLAAVEDPDRLCLVACGPGETPLAAPDLGRTAFGFYLEAGLRGAADGWGTEGDRDGRIAATELAAFVRGRVGRWAAATLRPPQTPVLVGDAEDFTVRAYPLSAPANPPDVSAVLSTEAGSAFTFPDWLRAGWERHDRWLAGGQAGRVPRAFALLRAALLAAERDFLAGRSASDVQQSLDRELARLDQLAAALTAAPAPNPLPTLAATFPGYVAPDDSLAETLADLTRIEPAPPTAPTKPGEKPPPPPLPAAFEPLLKKPHAEVALAAFRVLTEDPAPPASRVRRLAQLLAAQAPTPRYAETLLVQRLADLADPAAGVPWSADRAALALQTARAVEDVAARPEVVAWARPALDAVYQRRADAEAVLFAPGFASPTEAEARLRAAAEAAWELKAGADQLRASLATRDAAVFWLTGATPAVDSGLVPLADAVRLADVTRQLADTLVAPAAPVGAADLAALARDWRDREAAVRTALDAATVPFRADALRLLRGRAEAGDASPAVLADVDAALSTPSVPAAERAALWDVRATVARRLTRDAVRKDTTHDEAIRKRLGQPESLDPREVPAPASGDSERLTRRAVWTAALLRVGGVAEELTRRTEADLTHRTGDAAAFAARLRTVWTEDVPGWLATPADPDAASRLARVAPLLPATAFLDQPERNPDAARLRAQTRGLWAWQAARFEYDARDPVGPAADGTDFPFSILAARACAAVAGPPTGPAVAVEAPPRVALTAEQSAADVAVPLRLLGSASAQTVTVRVLSPNDEWARTGAEQETTLEPVRAKPVAVRVEAGERPSAHPELKGVLVEAAVGGRTYHRRVPVSLDALANRLSLRVRTDPAEEPRPVTGIDLRPNGNPQSYQLCVFNPTPKPRTVRARLTGLGVVTPPVTVKPEKYVPLKFPAAPPAAASAPPGSPPAAPTEPAYQTLTGPLTVELIDPEDPETVVQTITLPVRVLDPADFLAPGEVTFRPAGVSPNRLTVELVPRSQPPGKPVPVAVRLPADRNPAVLQVRDANLSGMMPATNTPLRLYAENIAFTGPTGGRLVVTVAADGVERAFTFEGDAPPAGGTSRLARATGPMVRVKPASDPVSLGGRTVYFALPAAPLPVALEVDNAPAGSRVELRLGTDTAGGFLADVVETIEKPKERSAAVLFDQKGDFLSLRGLIRDPAPALQVGLLSGERVLEARLLYAASKPVRDEAGNPISGRATVIFDGNAPKDVRFLDLPPRAGKGLPLAVRAACDYPISGLKEVLFFLGEPDKDGRPPANPPPAPGKQIDPKANVWQATLPTPKDADRVQVSVLFVTRTGRRKVETAAVELIDPAELNKPKPGKVAGTLTEGAIAQGDHPVFLYDEKGTPLAKATTKRDGTFEFPDVPPGKYVLYAVRGETRREARADVTVNAGETSRKDLELYLSDKTE